MKFWDENRDHSLMSLICVLSDSLRVWSTVITLGGCILIKFHHFSLNTHSYLLYNLLAFCFCISFQYINKITKKINRIKPTSCIFPLKEEFPYFGFWGALTMSSSCWEPPNIDEKNPPLLLFCGGLYLGLSSTFFSSLMITWDHQWCH